MAGEMNLRDPWLVAVWPGMGHVAVSAGYYLMAKLGMHHQAEFSAPDLFDVEHVEVRNGIIRAAGLPRNRFFVWHDPQQRHDILLFIGEAQPATGKYLFCQKLIAYAQTLGVQRVFTFAAMATQMHPNRPSRVFGAATDLQNLQELRQLDLTVLEEGNIGGLNGVLLGVAAEKQVPGICLLGEMPSIIAQLPYPKASLAVLRMFASISGISINYDELEAQAEMMDQKLAEILSKMEGAFEASESNDEELYGVASAADDKLSPEDERHIDSLFEQAELDRSKAYELKRELDRLEVFDRYEDRFLDLFKKKPE
jgi:proteasome assembly chaperone (PAC2) family protein